MRTLLILSMAFPSVAFAQADYLIPQCERAHDRCMKRAADIRSTFACRKARKSCRAATIDEATRNAQQPVTMGGGWNRPQALLVLALPYCRAGVCGSIMKREDFVKYLKKQISKPVRARERVAWGLDHPEVQEVIRRHEQAVAERKRSRSLRGSNR